jgi:hypothetical protein
VNLAEAEAFLAQRVSARQRAETTARASRGTSVRGFLFDRELALADDPHRYVTACCGRRSGKTTTMSAVLLMEALRTEPRFSVLYLSITRDQAKGVMWGPLKALNERQNLGGVPNEADLTMTMPNGVVIALRGVDKRKEIEKRRGYGFALVVIDECQSIPEHVRSLVDEVIEPALADAPGRLFMIGTPALLRAGYWFDCHHNNQCGPDGKPVWGHHFWNMWSNPHIADQDGFLAGVLARRAVTIDHASIRREYFGEWVRDATSAVFAFEPGANTYAALPRDLKPALWNYVISVDIGGGVERDNDAISVLAFHPHSRATWLTEEHIDPKQDVTALSQKVVAIRDRLGADRVLAIVADTGGIGAKVAQEMQRRHNLAVIPAKKADKWANIELLNGACRHGEFFAPAGSAFATEAVKVEKDWDKSTPDRIVIKGHMPDICDSVLYGFVESLGWISDGAPAAKPKEGTPEYAAMEADRMEREEEERIAQEIREQQGEPEGLSSPSDWENGWR